MPELKIRSVKLEDHNQLKLIHEKFYKEEFNFPDFLDKFLCVFVIEDEHNNIICAGGVRTIAESVIITNKDLDTHTKLKALAMMREANEFLCRNYGYRELHAFILNDDVWKAWLKRAGFVETKGKCYILGVN